MSREIKKDTCESIDARITTIEQGNEEVLERVRVLAMMRKEYLRNPQGVAPLFLKFFPPLLDETLHVVSHILELLAKKTPPSGPPGSGQYV